MVGYWCPRRDSNTGNIHIPSLYYLEQHTQPNVLINLILNTIEYIYIYIYTTAGTCTDILGGRCSNQKKRAPNAKKKF